MQTIGRGNSRDLEAMFLKPKKLKSIFQHKYSCFSAISTSTERENKQRLQT